MLRRSWASRNRLRGVIRLTNERPVELDPNTRLPIVLRILALLVVASTVLRFAWITDDALITVRHALNLSHGWGLGFNIEERVQAYTHPLWFLLITLGGLLTDSWAVIPILLGVACTTGAAAVILWSARSLPRIILAASLLMLSNAFIEFGTSGLENALSFLLVGALASITLGRTLQLSTIRALAVGLLTALALLNRLDLALVIGPAFALVLVANRKEWRALAALIAPPLVLVGGWMAFAQLTYGSPVPNTFLAKTNVDIPESELLVQGLRYMYVSITNDPVTGIALVAALMLASMAGTKAARCWALGIVGYLSYVTWIGGDFMAFRFLAVPVVVAVAVLAITPWTITWPIEGMSSEGVGKQPVTALLNLAAAVIIAFSLVLLSWGRAGATLARIPAEPRWAYYLEGQVSDERGMYAPWPGLWSYVQALGDTDASTARGNQGSRMVELTKAARNWPEASPGAQITGVQVQCGTLGQDAILSGPLIHWIDTCALADRFLASRPYVADNYNWRIGHFDREVPPGYVQAVLQGSPVLLERVPDQHELAAIWEDIR